jgi:molybdopterin molybdotransferase
VIEESLQKHQPDLLITTGGLGPGKFDYTRQVFRRLGGELLCTSLRIRPGKGTLLGMLGKRPFCALPGPPSAVRLLFYELLLPVLRCLEGATQETETLVEARLAQALRPQTKEAGKDVILQAACAWLDAQGQLWTRAAQPWEPVNAIIHLSGQEGDRVQLRLLGALN